MGVYLIGQVIRKTRESLGITQEELCDGICSVETLSRIENGKRAPNRANFEALMERMGKSGKKYLPYVHHQDIQVHLLMEKMNSYTVRYQYEKAEEILQQLEQRLELRDPVNHQLVLRYRAILDFELGKIDILEKRQKLIQALQCTVPGYREGDPFPNGFFMRTEMKIFMNLATSYAEEGDLTTAILNLEEIQKYYETIAVDREEKSRANALLLSNLARDYGRKGEYQKAKDIGSACMRQCLETQNSANLPSVLYGIAYEKELLEEEREECIELLLQAYYMAELQNNEYMMEHIKKHMVERYGEAAARWID